MARPILCGLIISLALGFIPQESYAQQKNSQYERTKERKNKKNRRLKRRGDKGRSNKGKLRSTKFKIRSRQGERAYKGDITGRKFETKRSRRPDWGGGIARPNPYAGRKRNSEGSRAKAYRQTPRYSSRQREKAWKGRTAGRATSSQSSRITFTGKNRSVSANQSITRNPERPQKVRRIIPRTASGAYRVRKRKRPYSIRERSQWEKAYKGDISGRKFRAKGSSIQPILQRAPKTRFSSRGKRGDRAYKGKVQAGYQSIGRPKEKAWTRDISGKKLRRRTSERPDFSGEGFKVYPKGKRKGDRAYRGKIKGGGFISVSSRKEKAGKGLLNARPPGRGTSGGVKFQGNVKSGKAFKGGGSISGKHWNNEGRAVQGRGPQNQDNRIAGFQGNVKGGRVFKGGGSVSGRRWNNQGQPLQRRDPKAQDNRTAGFQGNIKGGKVFKGGGSISGQRWNNQGQPLQRRDPKAQDNNTARFQGNIKGGKVFRGGGSVSGQRWNNQGQPLQRKDPQEQDNKTARFQGNVKGGRIFKGGGSVSGQMWNNKEKPLTRVEPRRQDNQIAGFQGNVKGGKVFKGGGSISGQLWNNDEKPLTRVEPKPQDNQIARFQGNKKSRTYKRNPNAADEALKVIKPNRNFFKTGDYLGNIKDKRRFKQNPNASDESLMNRPPEKAMAKATGFHGRFKTTAVYKKRPYAADGAMKGIGASKAAAQANNYQGNIKMKSKRLEDRHPDFKYLSLKSNGKKEKEKLFSFKLLWSRLFKKEENQPDYLKQKERKPRYDKKEEGLWNE